MAPSYPDDVWLSVVGETEAGQILEWRTRADLFADLETLLGEIVAAAGGAITA